MAVETVEPTKKYTEKVTFSELITECCERTLDPNMSKEESDAIFCNAIGDWFAFRRKNVVT